MILQDPMLTVYTGNELNSISTMNSNSLQSDNLNWIVCLYENILGVIAINGTSWLYFSKCHLLMRKKVKPLTINSL